MSYIALFGILHSIINRGSDPKLKDKEAKIAMKKCTENYLNTTSKPYHDWIREAIAILEMDIGVPEITCLLIHSFIKEVKEG